MAAHESLDCCAGKRGELGRGRPFGAMTQFLPKLVGAGERAPASRDEGAGDDESAASSPLPSAKPARDSRLAAEASVVVSTPPASQPAPASASLASPSSAEKRADDAAPKGDVRSDPFRQSLLLATGNLPLPPSAASRKPKPRRSRLSHGDYLATALLVAALAVAGFTFGRWRASDDSSARNASEQPATQQAKSGLRPPAPARADVQRQTVAPSVRELPLIPFVPLEVEPGHAQIWLDRELVGVGRAELGAIHDGALHELRFVAPEHETKTLFFRELPPAGRVRLKRTPVTGAVAAKAEGPRRAAPAPAQPRPAPRARPPAEAPAPAAESPPPKRPPHVQLIEVHTPRVQVLD